LAGRVVDTSNDTSESARAVGAQDLDAEDVGGLGKTVALTSSSGGDVSAVTVAIEHTLVGGIEDHVAASSAAAREVVVLAVDTSVDDVNVNAVAVGSGVQFVVGLSDGGEAGLSDSADADSAGKTPGVRRSEGLASLESAGDHVGLHVLDVAVGGEGLGRGLVHLDGVALEFTDRVGVHDVGLVHHRSHEGHVRVHLDSGVEHNNVLSLDDLGASHGIRGVDGRDSGQKGE